MNSTNNIKEEVVKEEVVFNKEQQEAFDLIVNGIGNVLLTGNAGTGKSFVIKHAIQALHDKNKTIQVCATTGLAATAIDGKTFHSVFSIFPKFAAQFYDRDGRPIHPQTIQGLINLTLDDLPVHKGDLKKKQKDTARLIRSLDVIIIDEVSMMHVHDLRRLDAQLQNVRNNKRPFGGIRMVFVGDFLQLEPVHNNNAAVGLPQGKSAFAYESDVSWKNAGIQIIQLTKIVRQQDEYFATFLNNIRCGIWHPWMQEVVDKCKSKPIPESGVPYFTSKNAVVDAINKREMEKLTGESWIHQAIDRYKGRWDTRLGRYVDDDQAAAEYWDKNCLALKTLELKVGTQVICLVNNPLGHHAYKDEETGEMYFAGGEAAPNTELVNGDVGVVIGFAKAKLTSHSTNAIYPNGIPVVEFKPRPSKAWRAREVMLFAFEAHTFNQGLLTESRSQFPIKPCWALTVHKSQGMTLDAAVVDIADAFSAGQVYVAMSRVRTLDGLYIKSFDADKIKAHEKSLEFYGIKGNYKGDEQQGPSEGNQGAKPIEPNKPNNGGGTMNNNPETHRWIATDEDTIRCANCDCRYGGKYHEQKCNPDIQSDMNPQETKKENKITMHTNKTPMFHQKQYEFLSNMYPCDIDGYKCVESFYQAMKSKDPAVRASIKKMDGRNAKDAGKNRVIVREDWESMKLKVMRYALEKKFAAGTELAAKLVATGDTILVETNYWHDDFWGDCYCQREDRNCKYTKGENHLGKMLMEIRDNLRNGGGGTPTNEPVGPSNNPKEEKMTQETKTGAPASIRKHEVLTPEVQQWLRDILERDVLPILETDVSSYARGRQRVWMPYQAPLDTAANMTQPFEPKLMHDALWQWIVDICHKHGMKAQTALISKGGSIKPHRDTTYAAEWAFGINLGSCKWSIASDRNGTRPDYTMLLKGGEVFSFNSKHVHSVSDVSPDRWAINVWAIADTNAARNARIHERIEEMLAKNPQLDEFIQKHQPGATNNQEQQEEEVIEYDPNEVNEPTMEEVKEAVEIMRKEIAGALLNASREVMLGEQIYADCAGGMRVITNDHNRFEIQKVRPSSSYTFAFLDHFFGGKEYHVHVMPQFINGEPNKELFQDDSLTDNVVIRWSSADKQYTITMADNNGWLDQLNKIGLVVGNSKKMAKRLQELVRQTAAYKYFEQLKIEVMDPAVIGVDEKFVDGISSISRSFAISLYTNNRHASQEFIDDKIKAINNGSITVVSLRVLTPIGLIKGNAIIVPDNMMNGYDIRTFTPNVKSELATTNWYWATIEPSFGRSPLKTDDLTMAIYRDVKGIVDPVMLIDTLRVVVSEQTDKIINGDPNDWIKQVREWAKLDADDLNAESYKLTKTVDKLVDRLEEIGLSIESSQLLMYLKALNFGQMYGVVDKKAKAVKPEFAYLEDNGTWMPVPYAYRAHIMTKEVLEIFGFKFKNKGYEGFYHEKSHCFVVPGEFFVANYKNHGGYDLDDTINVMIRQFTTKEGSNSLCAFLLRNPNDFSEWSEIPISPKEVEYCYHRIGDIPTISWEELNEKVPKLTDLIASNEITYKHEELPGASKIVLDPVYSIKDEIRNRMTTLMMPGGTGATVLPKIVYYSIVGKFISEQVASNEQLIDAVQQGMATPEDIAIIRAATDEIYRNVKQALVRKECGLIDSYWAETRITYHANKEHGFWGKNYSYVMNRKDSPFIQLYREREKIVREMFNKLTEWANDPHAPSKLMSIIDPDQGAAAVEFNRLMEKYYNVVDPMNGGKTNDWAREFVLLLEQSDAKHGEEYTDRKILRLWRHSFNMKRVKPKANWDKWLFVVDPMLDRLPIDWLIRAYRRLN